MYLIIVSWVMSNDDDDDDDSQFVECSKYPWESHGCGALYTGPNQER